MFFCEEVDPASQDRKRICLIAGGLAPRQLRLQPWRYLSEVARQLAMKEHEVTVITDRGPVTLIKDLLASTTIIRLPSIRNPRWRSNHALQHTLEQCQPDVILWHLGLTSLLYERYASTIDRPIVAIFTSPVYGLHDLMKVGPRKLARSFQLSAVHVAGALIPRPLLCRLARTNQHIKRVVVQTDTTRQKLLQANVWVADQVHVIPPGVDDSWHEFSANGQAKLLRQTLGYVPSDKIILYFGSPDPLRGLHTLIEALDIARRHNSSLKLLVLSRRRIDELVQQDARLRRLLRNRAISAHVKVISGYLPVEELVTHVAASDVVALPFQLVPSDAPLSVLEAQVLGKPVVTTTVGCLPELIGHRSRRLAEPGDPYNLAKAIQATVIDRHDLGDRNSHIASWARVGDEWSQLLQSL